MAGIAKGERVLTLCTGNICRSPFAEYWLRKRSNELGLVLEVASAGTHGLVGSPATDEALDVGTEHGVDLSPHVARALALDQLEGLDLLLAMTQGHERACAPMLSSVSKAPRVVVLGVRDPYGETVAAYRRCFAEIVEKIETLLGGA